VITPQHQFIEVGVSEVPYYAFDLYYRKDTSAKLCQQIKFLVEAAASSSDSTNGKYALFVEDVWDSEFYPDISELLEKVSQLEKGKAKVLRIGNERVVYSYPRLTTLKERGTHDWKLIDVEAELVIRLQDNATHTMTANFAFDTGANVTSLPGNYDANTNVVTLSGGYQFQPLTVEKCENFTANGTLVAYLILAKYSLKINGMKRAVQLKGLLCSEQDGELDLEGSGSQLLLGLDFISQVQGCWGRDDLTSLYLHVENSHVE